MHLQGEGSFLRRTALILAHLVMALLFFAAVALGFGYAVMRLWNAILPAVAAVHPLSYWQAVGLLVLCRILIGGFHSAHGQRRHSRHGLKCCGLQKSDSEEDRNENPSMPCDR